MFLLENTDNKFKFLKDKNTYYRYGFVDKKIFKYYKNSKHLFVYQGSVNDFKLSVILIHLNSFISIETIVQEAICKLTEVL